MPFSFEVKTEGKIVLFYLKGSLTVKTQESLVKLLESFQHYLHENPTHFIVDLMQVPEIDESGLGMLHLLEETAQGMGIIMNVRNPQRAVKSEIDAAKSYKITQLESLRLQPLKRR